jgi:two-component system chemotaxis response regulator CheB
MMPPNGNGIVMHDIIVVGASAGGVEALVTLIHQLPATIPAAIFVVIHFPPQATSVLPRLLNRAGHLLAHHAGNGEEIRHGHIYVAPPDWHLIIQDGYVDITRGPQENRHRPAIDPLFRSAALHYGSRVMGVLLSGMQDDGSAGLQAIKSRGGITICQEPTEAIYPDMPRNAIEQVGVDYVLTITKMAALLMELTSQSTTTPPSDDLAHQQLKQETEIAALNWSTLGPQEPPGISSTIACPSCGGVLWQMQDGSVMRYRCRVGHAFSAHELLASQESHLENALWTALRALEERASLLQTMKERAQTAERPYSAKRLHLQKQEAEERATLVRNVLMSGGLAALAEAGSEPPPMVSEENPNDQSEADSNEF